MLAFNFIDSHHEFDLFSLQVYILIRNKSNGPAPSRAMEKLFMGFRDLFRGKGASKADRAFKAPDEKATVPLHERQGFMTAEEAQAYDSQHRALRVHLLEESISLGRSLGQASVKERPAVLEKIQALTAKMVREVIDEDLKLYERGANRHSNQDEIWLTGQLDKWGSLYAKLDFSCQTEVQRVIEVTNGAYDGKLAKKWNGNNLALLRQRAPWRLAHILVSGSASEPEQLRQYGQVFNEIGQPDEQSYLEQRAVAMEAQERAA